MTQLSPLLALADRRPSFAGTLAIGFLAATLAAPVSAQAVQGGALLDFDLVEINAEPNPLHPGVTFEYTPSGDHHYGFSSGIAVADFNADGYQDLFMGAAEGAPNHLYVNNGDGTFTEAANLYRVDEPTKRRANALFFDLENDGDLDLLTMGYPGHVGSDTDLYTLFRNNGAPHYSFTNVTESAGAFVFAPTEHTTEIGGPGGAAVADYDRDGYLDLVVTYFHRHLQPPPGLKDQMRLWKNLPNPNPDKGQNDYSERVFEDATLEAGLDMAGGDGWSWMPNFVDVDRDGWTDLHLNIESGPDELRMNRGDGTFGPSIATAIGMNFNELGAWGNEMGIGFADYDNDLDLDFYATNVASLAPFKEDAFYRNDSNLGLGGGLSFQHIAAQTGTDQITGIGWGVVFPDLDNDGDKDLVSVRGMGPNYAHNWVHRNLYPQVESDGVTVALEDVSTQVPDFHRPDSDLDVARALVAFDYDNDGDLDLAYTRTEGGTPSPGANLRTGFFLNTLDNGNGFLQLDLVAADGGLNVIGARVFVRTGGVNGVVQVREVKTGDSFLAQNPLRLHFGLGAADEADWVLVRWPDGSQEVLLAVQEELSGIVALQHGPGDASGDLNGDLSVDCADLALFVEGIGSPAAVDAQVPDLPWRQLADLDGNGVRDLRDYEALRALVAASLCDVGGGAGGPGGAPVLALTGTPNPGAAMSLELSNAPASSPAILLLGQSSFLVPLNGAILVPLPEQVVVVGSTDGGGALSLPFAWPGALPPGVGFEWQVWLPDVGAPSGVAATNGVSSIAER